MKFLVALLVFLSIFPQSIYADLAPGESRAVAVVASSRAGCSFNLFYLLDKIQLAESSGRSSCIGNDGLSRGAYQIKESTWKQYSRLDWKKYAHDPKESRIVAGMIVSDLIKKAKKSRLSDFNRKPYATIAMLYNAGPYTKFTVDRWQKWTHNQIYKSL